MTGNLTTLARAWAQARRALLAHPDSGDRGEYRRLLDALADAESALYKAAIDG